MSHDQEGHEHGEPARFSFAGRHSHDHSAFVDHALESSERGIRAVKLSLIALLVTASLQVIVVAISDSVALLSDTLHNFADAMTALPLWLAFSLGRRAPTRRYTYGYGRAEDLAGVFIVVVVAVSAAFAGYEAVDRLIDPRPVRNLPLVVAAALIGFAGNELVALYRLRVGREIGSAALVADGYHARTDGLTSLGVLAGALGVALGYEQADAIVGALIALTIVALLIRAARDIYRRLMDAVDPGLVERVESELGAVDGMVSVDQVHLRWIGHQLRAEVEVTVDPELTVEAGHEIAVAAHHRLLHEIPRLTSVIVHAGPADREGHDHHEILAHHPRAFKTRGD